jgi:O-antigen ligase
VTATASAYALRMLDAARACFIASAAALPLSTAATNLFAVLGFCAWLLSGQWRPTLRAVAAEPAASLGWLLFALLALGIAWSLAPVEEAAGALLKYRELLLFGIVLFVFADERWRHRLLASFLAGTLVLLAMSFAVQLGLMEFADERGFSSAQNAVLLKNHITHGLLISLLAYGAAVVAMGMSGWRRWTLAAVAALALFNVLFSIQGRTGYIVVSALMLWLGYSRWSLRGVAAAGVALAMLVTAAYQWSPAFQVRVAQTASEADERQARSDLGETSIGSRLHFWKRSAEWLVERPVLGAGTGGWAEAFYRATEGDDAFMHNRDRDHPHNEYIHLAVQLGPAGFLLFVALLVAAFRSARRLPSREAALAQGLILAFAIAALFNDVLRDTTEGHMWALIGGALFGASRALSRS